MFLNLPGAVPAFILTHPMCSNSPEKMIVQKSFELMRVQTLCLILFVASSKWIAASSNASLGLELAYLCTVCALAWLDNRGGGGGFRQLQSACPPHHSR